MACIFMACGGGKKTADVGEVNNFDKDYEKLDKLYKEYENLLGKEASEDERVEQYNKIMASAKKYVNTAEEVMGKEARYLISLQDEEATQRLDYLFDELKIVGEKLPEGYICNTYDDYLKYDCYLQSIKCNNNLCNIAFNLGLRGKDKKLCELALSHYLPNGILHAGEYFSDKIKTSDEDVVRYQYTDKMEAESKYNEAFGEKEEDVEEEEVQSSPEESKKKRR